MIYEQGDQLVADKNVAPPVTKLVVLDHHKPVAGDILRNVQAGCSMVGGKEVVRAAVFFC